jgi:hypothetical protein
MIPLLIANFLFNEYIRQQHYRVATYLPSRQCMKTDVQNGPDFDLNFVKDAYIQEELLTKLKFPEVTPRQRNTLQQQGVLLPTTEFSIDGISMEQSNFDRESLDVNRVNCGDSSAKHSQQV